MATAKKKTSNNAEHPIVLGRGGDGRLVETTLSTLKSTLISGVSGSGKSNLIKNIIRQSCDQAQVIVSDPKRVSYLSLQDELDFTLITDINDTVKLLSKLTQLMEKRYEAMEQARTDKCDAMPILCIIDEFAEITTTVDENTKNQIRRLLSMGRACRIYVIMATQQASRRIISGALLDLFCSRISLRQNSRYASKLAIEVGGAENLPNYVGLYRNENGFLTQFNIAPPSDQQTKEMNPNDGLDLSDIINHNV